MQIRDQKPSPKVNEEALLLCPALSRISSSTVSPANRDKLISQLLEDIKNLFKASFCWISITINGAFILKSYGSVSARNKLSRSELLTKLTPEILNKAYPLLHNRGSGPINQENVLSQFLREQNFHNLMGVPLKRGTKVFGTLNVVRKNESSGYHRADQKLLSSFGHLLETSFDHHTEEGVQPSERKKLHKFSKSEQLKVNQVTKNIGVGLAIISKDFRTLWANDVLTGIFGKVEGKKCYFVYNRRSKVCPGCGVREILKTGKSEIKHEQEGKDKYGNTIWSQIIATPIKDEAGKISAVMEVVVPITKHKLIENALVQKERIARERAQLLNDLRFLNKKDEILNRACRAIRDSGLFERAVMTLHDASRQITHLGQIGLPRKVIQLAQKAPPLDRKQIKRIMNKRFRISDSFFIPVEAGLDLSQSGRYISQKKSTLHAEWQIGDELFVPLLDFSGTVMGYLSVDTPTDGCRPDIKRIQSVEMLAEAAASRIRELDAQKAIEESERKYRLLVENMKEGIYSTHKGVFINVNESMCRLFGYRRDELMGMSAWNLAMPEKRKMIKRLFFRKAAKRDFSPAEVECRRKDGTSFIAEIKLSAISEKQQFLGMISDITTRKSAEDERLKIEEKYRLVVKNANEAIVIAQEGYLKFVNPKMTEIFGYSEKELLSKPFSKLIHSEDRKTVLERHLRRIKGEDVPSIYDFQVIDKKGRIKWLEINAVAITWESKPATLNFLSDITKRKQDEQLKEQYQEQKMLFELTQAISSAIDLDQMLKIATKKMTEFLRIERGSIILVNPDEKSATFKTLHVRTGYGVTDLIGFTFKSDSFTKLKALVIKQPFVINDVSTLPQGSFIRSLLLSMGIKSNLSVSLFYRDKFLGSLTVATKIKYHDFTAEETRLLQIIANTLSATIVNYQLLEDLKFQAEKLDSQFKEQKMLFELSQALSSASDLDHLLKIATEKTMEIIGVERSSIALANSDRKSDRKYVTVRAIQIRGKLANLNTLGSQIPFKLSPEAAFALIHGKPFLLNDTFSLPSRNPLRKRFSKLGIKSIALVPLVSRDSTLGFLAISSMTKVHQYTPAEIGLLRTIASPIAAAIDNYFLVENLKTQSNQLDIQLKEQRMLYELTQNLSSAKDLDQLLKSATKKVTEFMNIERSSIILVNPDGSATFRAIYVQGEINDSSLVGYIFKSDNFAQLTKLFIRKPFVISDTSMLPKSSYSRNFFHQIGIKSNLTTALFSRGKFIGCISIATKNKHQDFAPRDIRLMQIIANTIATIIENFQLLEDSKFQAEKLDSQFKEQKMLFELTQDLSFAADMNQLRKVSVQMVAKIMHAERAAIGVITPKGDSFTIQEILIKGKHGDPYSLEFVKPTFTAAIKDMMSKNQPSIVHDTSIYPKGSLERKIISQRGIKAAMGVPLVSHNKDVGFLAISSLSQIHHYTQDEVQLLQTLSNPIAMAIENRMLLEDLKNQAANLEKQTREKDILLKVSQSLSQTMELNEITKVASQVIGTALGVDRCSIILLSSDGNHVEVKGIYSKLAWREQKLVGKQYSVNIEKYWKTVIKKRKVLVINDIAKSSQQGIIQEHHLQEGLKSLLVTGMFFGKKLLGVLALSSLEEVRTFVPDEIKLIQAIANQVAVAIENARLVQVVKIHTQELKELSSQLMKAQENERKKIAQELHDQVGQMLQSMKMNLDRIKRFLSADPQKMGETKEWMVDIENLLSQTIDDIRTLTFDLRPSMLDDFGLFSTLRWYLDDYIRRSNLKVLLKGKEEKYRFPLEVEVNLYRIIQEALTNVAKHAQATEVVIYLSRKHSTAILSVKDNGKGFDAHKLLSSSHKGTGIFNMNERVNLLGGSFEIVSEPGKGTRVNVNIPYAEVKYEED